MKASFFRIPENSNAKARYAFFLIAFFLFIVLGILGFLIFQVLSAPSPQIWLSVVFTGVSAVCMVIGLILARRNRHELGIWLALLPLGLTWIQAVFTYSGLGYVLAAVMAVGFVLMAILTLSGRQAVVFGVIGVAGAAVIMLLDNFLPAGRLSIGILASAVNYAVGAVLLVFGYIIIRQYRNFSFRTKLIIAFNVVTVIPLAIVILVNNNASGRSLASMAGNTLSGLSIGQARQVGQALATEMDILNTLSLTQAVQQRAAAGTVADTLSQSEIQALDQQWRTADAANNNSDPLVARVLNDSLSAELRKLQAKYPENVEIFLTDLPGISLAATGRASDYLQSDEPWWQAALKNRQYIGQPEFDASSNTLVLNMAVVVFAPGTHQAAGILHTTVNINSLGNVLGTGLLGRTGRTDIYLPDGQKISLTAGSTNNLAVDNAPIDITTLLTSRESYQAVSIDNIPSLVSVAAVADPNAAQGNTLVKDLGWYAVTHQDRSDALQSLTDQNRRNMILGIGMALLSVLAAILLAQMLAGPIVRLGALAKKASAGDLTVQARVEASDETGALAATFNEMISQLRELIATLEQRVTARTKDLATVAEVSTATATILKTDQLLQEVVDLTKERFNLYHSHIYLLDESGQNLVLAAGAGEPGRQMVAEKRSIPLSREQSLVARAARERKGVTVNDVTQAPDFLPNPLLPNTRSELAVPMIVGGNVIGVFDIQSDQVRRFADTDINIQTTLAAQVATSVQNVRSFERTREKAELETLVNTIGQQIQRTTTVEETLQTAIRGIGMALGAQRVKASITRHISDGNESSNN